MFGAFPFAVPLFAGPPTSSVTPTPTTAHRVRDTFDHWLNGIPVLVPEFDGSFSQWLNGAPDVDQGAQSTPLFSGSGIATASAFLGHLVSNSVAGIGIAKASSFLGHLEAHPASGTGISQASAFLSGSAPRSASGTGIAKASSRLVGLVPAVVSGTGISIGSAILTTALPSLAGHGFGVARASAVLTAFVTSRPGPALPGFPSIQESIPQFVTMFGFTLQPILDVLKLRRVPLNYVSPPVCPGVTTPIHSGSSQATPVYL